MSKIVPFFRDKTIFLTGASGFIGKLLVEQILRKCEPKKVYLLMRSKKGVEPSLRTQALFQEKVFDKLKNSKSNILQRTEIISGDVGKGKLGLSEESLRKIIEEVDVVIHGAAILKLEEDLKPLLDINVKGTISIIELCHQIKNLKALTIMSSAYSNCFQTEIKEQFYDIPVSAEELLSYDDSTLRNLTSKFIKGKWPNTYTFSKAVVEDAVRRLAKGLPVSVVRPSMITSTIKDPLPGWVDNQYGIIGYLALMHTGLIKTLYHYGQERAEMVPADMVANCIMAATYNISTIRSNKDIPIYNMVNSSKNILKWEDCFVISIKYLQAMPITKMVMAPSLIIVKNQIVHWIVVFITEILPALVIDAASILTNNKPRALTSYWKAHHFATMGPKTVFQTGILFNDNTNALWKSLSKEDQKMFDFNMDTVEWPIYLKTIIAGMRLHLFKDPPENLDAAIARYKRLRIFQHAVNISLSGFLFCMVYLLV